MDVRSLVERDWALIEREKRDFWIARKSKMSPAEALRVSDELRRYVRAVRPDWPSQQDRENDLATHERVSRALQNAAARAVN